MYMRIFTHRFSFNRLLVDWHWWRFRGKYPDFPMPYPSVDILQSCAVVLYRCRHETMSSMYSIDDILVHHRTMDELLAELTATLDTYRSMYTFRMSNLPERSLTAGEWYRGDKLVEVATTALLLAAELENSKTGADITTANRMLVRIAKDIYALTKLVIKHREL